MPDVSDIFGPRIHKVTVNMGVGEAGEKLDKAKVLLERLTTQKPIERLSQMTIKDWHIRTNLPIACMVTLRKQAAIDFLKKAFLVVDNKIHANNFDKEGNFSFGIKEHIEFAGEKYDSRVGIYGMDVCVTLEKAGYRIKRRKRKNRRVPNTIRIKKEEAINYIQKAFDVKVS